MTREEAKEILTHNWTRVDNPNYSESELDEAFFMAIEALSANATVAKIQIDDIDKAKTSSQLLDDLAVDMVNAMDKRIVEVVRCKECRHRDLFSCPLADNDFQKDDDFCSWGERKEPLPQYEEWQDEFNKMCENAKPKTFVADEWYRDTFGENDGKQKHI